MRSVIWGRGSGISAPYMAEDITTPITPAATPRWGRGGELRPRWRPRCGADCPPLGRPCAPRPPEGATLPQFKRKVGVGSGVASPSVELRHLPARGFHHVVIHPSNRGARAPGPPAPLGLR